MKKILLSTLVAIALIAAPVAANHQSQLPEDCAVDEVLVSVEVSPEQTIPGDCHFVCDFFFIFCWHGHQECDPDVIIPAHFEDMCIVDPDYVPPTPPQQEPKKSGGGICTACVWPMVETDSVSVELTMDGQVVHFLTQQMGTGGVLLSRDSHDFPRDHMGKPMPEGMYFFPFGYEREIVGSDLATYHSIRLGDLPPGQWYARTYFIPDPLGFPGYGRSFGPEVLIDVY